MAMLFLLLVVASLANFGQADEFNLLESAILKASTRDCLSWRVANEAHNMMAWTEIPESCKSHFRMFMKGKQYRADCKIVIDEAIRYVQTVPKNDKNIWIFDIDETVLSNAKYIIEHDLYGSHPAAMEAQPEGAALPESRRLYNETAIHGIQNVFLSGRAIDKEDETIANLVKAGYDNSWEKLILKSEEYENMTGQEYKSTIRGKLEEEGYIIVGNIGDQWSDLLGPSAAKRSFKLPNPMYFLISLNN